MIHFVYEAILWLAAPIFIPWHYVRALRRKRPPALVERFGSISRRDLARLGGEGPIWIHAVSVGETIAVKPLIKALRERFPQRKILVSNGTETGRGVAQQIAEADLCIYFPFDFGFAVRKVLNSVRPAIVLVVETEIWPNFLRTARSMGIPTLLVNGRISDRSFPRYLKFARFFRAILDDFSLFCMQTDEDARRIVAIGAPAHRVEVTRNLKYDIPVAVVGQERGAEIRSAFRIPAGVPVFTAGSTHQGEDEIVLASFLSLVASGRKCFMILAPRHPERAAQVAELLAREQVGYDRRTKIGGRTVPLAAGEVLLVDSVGELMQLYAVSDVVFVGGSLVPTGGHNILEPVSLKVPVLFGPHMSNFREAAALVLSCGGGVQVDSGEELAVELAKLLDDEARRRDMGGKGARLLEQNSGSTTLHVRAVERFLAGG